MQCVDSAPIYMSMMSVRKGHRELQAGVERLEKMWDNMVEKHLSERIIHFLTMLSAICFAGSPASSRSIVGIALGGIPHVAILFFTVLVVWTAQPSSSQ